MKYIIKNCPAIMKSTVCVDDKYSNLCQDITGCLLKQIVDECKKEKIINCNIDGKEQILKAYHYTHKGDKILELIEIEEVDEM